MVKIRLMRLGRHKLPIYRIVAIDQRKKLNGEYIALIGEYNPQKKFIKINDGKALNLLAKGAKPTETVMNIFKKKGIWSKYLSSKKPKKNKKRKLSAKMKSKKLSSKNKQKKSNELPKKEVKNNIKSDKIVANKDSSIDKKVS